MALTLKDNPLTRKYLGGRVPGWAIAGGALLLGGVVLYMRKKGTSKTATQPTGWPNNYSLSYYIPTPAATGITPPTPSSNQPLAPFVGGSSFMYNPQTGGYSTPTQPWIGGPAPPASGPPPPNQGAPLGTPYRPFGAYRGRGGGGNLLNSALPSVTGWTGGWAPLFGRGVGGLGGGKSKGRAAVTAARRRGRG